MHGHTTRRRRRRRSARGRRGDRCTTRGRCRGDVAPQAIREEPRVPLGKDGFVTKLGRTRLHTSLAVAQRVHLSNANTTRGRCSRGHRTTAIIEAPVVRPGVAPHQGVRLALPAVLRQVGRAMSRQSTLAFFRRDPGSCRQRGGPREVMSPATDASMSFVVFERAPHSRKPRHQRWPSRDDRDAVSRAAKKTLLGSPDRAA